MPDVSSAQRKAQGGGQETGLIRSLASEVALGVPNGEPAEKYELLKRCLWEEDEPHEDE